jgi:DNA-binding response OmpR family regulator
MTKRLLLVEDELTLARALARLLRRAGFEVFPAGSCDEAREAPGTFSLGVFDIQLPDGDGVALAEELSTSTVRRVVFFSGIVSGVQRRRAERLGPFVEKSSGFSALLATIQLALADIQVKVAGDDDASGISNSSPPSGIRINGKPDKPN